MIFSLIYVRRLTQLSDSRIYQPFSLSHFFCWPLPFTFLRLLNCSVTCASCFVWSKKKRGNSCCARNIKNAIYYRCMENRLVALKNCISPDVLSSISGFHWSFIFSFFTFTRGIRSREFNRNSNALKKIW